jgi:predicted metal-binding protein
MARLDFVRASFFAMEKSKNFKRKMRCGMKIAILVREETMMRCTASGCMNAFFQRIDSFARYQDQEHVELVAFTHNGGDLDKKIATLQKKGVDVIHLSSCIRGKDENYESLAKQLSKHFAVVGYTHGEENGEKGKAIILPKDDHTGRKIDDCKQ